MTGGHLQQCKLSLRNYVFREIIVGILCNSDLGSRCKDDFRRNNDLRSH
jgi:hypothetical protein